MCSGYILLGKMQNLSDRKPRLPSCVLSSQAAPWAWEAGQARQLPQAAWAPWEQTRPSAGSPAWRSITLHY